MLAALDGVAGGARNSGGSAALEMLNVYSHDAADMFASQETAAAAAAAGGNAAGAEGSRKRRRLKKGAPTAAAASAAAAAAAVDLTLQVGLRFGWGL